MNIASLPRAFVVDDAPQDLRSAALTPSDFVFWDEARRKEIDTQRL
jgi:hypothetical protein